jgi:acyl transferase domain-containing protein/acyl carrier protein
VIRGDIADPAAVLGALRAAGIEDADEALHVRTFLDHDRPWIPPADAAAVARRAEIPSGGVYVDADGAALPAPAVVQSLVEHFARWAPLVERHGLLLLEVHSLDADTVARFRDESENLHFDAYHAFSRQYLVEADTFLMCLAEAGLFPRRAFARRYPRALPFTRITLNWIERRGYRARHPHAADLPALAALEAACWPAPLRASAGELRDRLRRDPTGQCVIEREGRILAAAYSQRIAGIDALRTARHADVPSLHRPGGPVVQLLGVNVLPDAQDQGLGDELLDFMLQLAGVKPGVEAVAGITRCRNAHEFSSLSMAEYAGLRDARGEPVDPVLRFHAAHGAGIAGVVEGYRPEDAANRGHGVLVAYEVLSGVPPGRGRPAGGARDDVLAVVSASIRGVLGERRAGGFSATLALRDMGCDSLDLLELRHALARQLGVDLDPTVFFRYPTAKALAAYLEERIRGVVSPVVNPRAAATPARAGAPATISTTPAIAAATAVGPAPEASAGAEPIAIIGLDCRFPGGADGPEGYWTLLREGRDAIGEPPVSRAPGMRPGGFLERVDELDAAFFHIAPREASAMDPQQRLLLEGAWHALEHAGIDPTRLAGRAAGVFVGLFAHDYEILQLRAARGPDPYFGSGVSAAVAAGRIAYVLDLRGPALTVDTACSSSLVAVHLACRSLRAGECEIALAAGVNLLLTPELTTAFAEAGMLAADARCKTLDARADGYVRSEGCAVVVLKRLSRALADGDRVLAVVRGTAINQDGASNGLTAPNGAAQQAVIRAALADAGVAPGAVSYVELHGTGTALGDPIEVEALGQVFGAEPRPAPLAIGSVKTNIGHTEAAAGLAGLIKLVLALEHETIPAHLHFRTLNPALRLDGVPFVIPTEPVAWPRANAPRLAGVSSFGFSGTNAHVILEEAPAPQVRPASGDRHLVALSAATERAARALATAYAGHLGTHPEIEPANVALTANAGRAHLSHRIAVTGIDTTELRDRLVEAARAGTERARGPIRRLAFLFTGQGSQYAGMGAGLARVVPSFRERLERCDVTLAPLLGRSLFDLLDGPDSGRLHETAFTQPALFALEWALADLWRAWGVVPAAVMGHSVGEYVAACVAGILDVEDALRLVARRGQLMQALPAGGAMMAVLASPEAVAAALAPWAAHASIAAVNGPRSVVVSGAEDAVTAVAGALGRGGARATRLPVSHAFHSPLMTPMLEAFRAAARGVAYRAPSLDLVSNVSGTRAGAEIATADYWVRHARAPVEFARGMAALRALGCDAYLEIGPKPVLLAMGRSCVGADGATWLPSLREGHADWDTLLDALATLYTGGVPVDWAAFHRDRPGRTISLPRYPFERTRHWIEPVDATPSAVVTSAGAHPLLGRRLRSAHAGLTFEAALAPSTPAYLADHRVRDAVTLPASAAIETALAAGLAWRLRTAAATRGVGGDLGLPAEGRARVVVHDLRLPRALTLAGDRATIVQTLVTSREAGEARVQMLSLGEDEAWTLHAEATLRSEAPSARGTLDLDAVRRACAVSVSPDVLYARWRARGIEHGPCFRALDTLGTGAGEALGRIRVPAVADVETYTIHPAALDGCLQVALAALPCGDDVLPLPVGTARVAVAGPATGPVWCHARVRDGAAGATRWVVDVTWGDDHGTVLGQVDGLAFAAVAVADGRPRWREALYEVAWRPRPLDSGAALAQAISSDAVLAQTLRTEAATLATREEALRAAGASEAMEGLATTFVVHALATLGWSYAPGDRFTTEAACAALGIALAHRRLFARLLEIVAEEGILRRDDGDWEALTVLPSVDVAGVRTTVDAYPGVGRERALLARFGEVLPDVLRGTQDPLALLFPAGDLADAAHLYAEAPTFSAVNRLAGQAVAAIAASAPPDRRIRVLEIGAGTGATTAAVLAHLPPGRSHYTFSDVSPFFLGKARETLARAADVAYRVFDVERAPGPQGLAPGGYDVVIASNVLHATRDLKTTVATVRDLLAPGGSLVLIEGTERRRWIDLVFGTMAGWWRFDDAWRADHPLLAADGWRRVLAEAGFDDVVAAPPPGLLFPQSVLVARTAGAEHAAADAPGAWIVLEDAGGVGARLAAALAEEGDATIVVERGATFADRGPDAYAIDPDAPGDYRRLLAAVNAEGAHPQNVASAHRPRLRGIVHLWSLDAPPARALSAAALDATWSATCGSVLALVKALAAAAMPAMPALSLVTRGAVAVDDRAPVSGLAQSPLHGLARVLAHELPELACRSIDLDPADADVDAPGLAAALRAADAESQVALRGGVRFVARLVPGTLPETPAMSPVRLVLQARGTLDGLALEPAERRAPGPGEVVLRVLASGLNFRDVANALDAVPGDAAGLECVGRVERVGHGVTDLAPGDVVVALAPGSFATYVTVGAALVVKKPEALAAEDAATLPIAFLTARYALERVAGLGRGERVLIHAAAGGVGLAACQLALAAGADVFATASPAKWEALRRLGVRHVASSRDLEFVDAVLAWSGGRGADVVLNSLAGPFIDASFAALADDGRFVELGKRGVLDAGEAARRKPRARYVVVDLLDVVDREPAVVRGLLEDSVARAAAGTLAPLPVTTFPLARVHDAFEHMAHARHVGKIVVTQAEPRAFARASTWLITGGLGGLGRTIGRWLADRGVGHLVLVGRRPPTVAAEADLAALRATGADVRVVQADVADADAVAGVLADVRASCPPLCGVVHAAGVLDDGVLTALDRARLRRVMAPKALGAWHLHEATRPLALEHFVLCSSAVSLLGWAGQASHAAANAFLDALAHHRRRMGLPAVSIQWGPWSGIGAAASADVLAWFRAKGIGALVPADGLAALAALLDADRPQVGVVPVDWPAFTRGTIPPFLSELPAPAAAAPARAPRLAAQLADLLPAQRRVALTRCVRTAVAQVLGMPSPDAVPLRTGFFALGMDSLTSLELRGRLSSELDRVLTPTVAFDHPTVEALVAHLDGLVDTESHASDAPAAALPLAIPDEIAKLSDREAEALLLSRLAALGSGDGA